MTNYVWPKDKVPTVLNSEDTMEVLPPGTATGFTLNGALAFLNEDDSKTSLMTVNFQGKLQVVKGTVDLSTINEGGWLTVFLGTADHTTINPGGLVWIGGHSTPPFPPGSAISNNTTIQGGTEEIFGPSGVSNKTLIVSGQQNVFGGVSNETLIQKDGVQNIHSGGQSMGTHINGGVENVFSGGVSEHTVVAHGVENVFSGGVSEHTVVARGGVENLDGGKSFNSEIQGGGIQEVLKGGIADNTVIRDGGVQNIREGGLSQSATFNGVGGGNGGVQNVYKGGIADHSHIFLAGTINVHDGGVAKNALLSLGGHLNVFAGGTASDTVLDGHSVADPIFPVMHVFAGGTAINVFFSSIAPGVDRHTGLLELERPTDLHGTIFNMCIGDRIDFLHSSVVFATVNAEHTTVTVGFAVEPAVTYSLVNMQGNTDFAFDADGHGGSVLTLMPGRSFVAVVDEPPHIEVPVIGGGVDHYSRGGDVGLFV